MIRRAAMIWLAMFCVSSNASEAVVSIAALEIPGVLQADRKGAYDRVLTRLSEMAGRKWQFVHLPAKRVDMVLAKTDGCAFPFDLGHFNEISTEQKGKLISAEPFNIGKVFLFTRTGKAPQGNPMENPEFRLGAKRGVPFGKEFDLLLATHPNRVQLLNSDDSGVKMLLANRIDGLLAYFPDMSVFFRENQKPPLLSYDPLKPIITHRDSVVCAATKENQAFIEQLNTGIVKLRKSGKLKEILGEYYVNP